MKIKFKYFRYTEQTPFSKGRILVLPSPFFRYVRFGKIISLHVGFLFLSHEYSFSIRNELKLAKQTQTKAG